jgi:hypothetical protein
VWVSVTLRRFHVNFIVPANFWTLGVFFSQIVKFSEESNNAKTVLTHLLLFLNDIFYLLRFPWPPDPIYIKVFYSFYNPFCFLGRAPTYHFHDLLKYHLSIIDLNNELNNKQLTRFSTISFQTETVCRYSIALLPDNGCSCTHAQVY